MLFSNYPRIFFAHLPTPLEPLKNLSKLLDGPNLWIKRDDCTGLAGGGNKTRKLEFLMGDALEQKADLIITQGATQSNHVRQTAAIATQMGLECHVLLEDRTESKDLNHNENGNVLLDKLFHAKISRFPKNTDMVNEMELLADKLKQDGRKPYIIPGGGSNKVGALGYANAAFELVYQANSMNLKIDHVVHATGSTGTQAGLVAGLKGINSHIQVLGIGVRFPRAIQEEKVLKCCQEVAEHLNLNKPIQAADIVANCDYIGEGYGFPAPSTLEAIDLLAKHEAILLDPVYSGKGMAGLIDLVRKGHFKKNQNIVFIHTGGAQALFGYLDNFKSA